MPVGDDYRRPLI